MTNKIQKGDFNIDLSKISSFASNRGTTNKSIKNTIKTEVENIDIQPVSTSFIDIIDSIINGTDIEKEVVNVFENNNLDFVKTSDIASVDVVGINKDSLKVTLKDGMQYLFTKENDRLYLRGIIDDKGNNFSFSDGGIFKKIGTTDKAGDKSNITNISSNSYYLLVETEDGTTYYFNNQGGMLDGFSNSEFGYITGSTMDSTINSFAKSWASQLGQNEDYASILIDKYNLSKDNISYIEAYNNQAYIGIGDITLIITKTSTGLSYNISEYSNVDAIDNIYN